MLDDFLKNSPIKDVWKKIGLKHHYGINLPLSALVTKKSCGTGEFLDLIPVIDWVKEIGFDTIQLLPLNDTGEDPSPYNALSSCALHPIYLSLHALPYLTEQLQKNLKTFTPLNSLKRIDYKQVYHKKLLFLRAYFSEAKDQIQASDKYQKFLKENSFAREYALFKTLKELYKNVHFQDFPENLKNPNHSQLQRYYKQYQEKIDFYLCLQFLCFEQLSQVKTYASEKNCLLKGDIPILISPDSVDVWMHRDLFDITLAAGAPPDIFNPEGQYWGFPIYRWNIIEKQNFHWWEQRLKYASAFYHIYRIDHIIGFFRIFVIPRGKKPKDGAFYPKREDLMLAQGKLLLQEIIKHSNMLPIGEDLGVIPEAARNIMYDLGIAGTKVFRWEREFETTNDFIQADNFPPLSMATVSTHDSETLELWWSENSEGKEYAEFKNWKHEIPLSPSKRFEILQENLHNPSLFHINLLQEYLALIPDLVWENPQDERINIPGFVLPENWTYRFKPRVEEFTSNKELKAMMLKLLTRP